MKSLDKLYTLKGILKDNNNGGLSDDLRGKIIIDKNSSITEKKVAINLCGRLSFESTALNLPIVKFNDNVPNCENLNIIIEPIKNPGDSSKKYKSSIDFKKGKDVIIKSSSSTSLENVGQYLYSRFPYIWEVNSNTPKLDNIKDVLFNNLNTDKITISEIILDERYIGIDNLIINIKCNNIMLLEKDIKNNINKLKWTFIKKLTFIMNDGSLTKELLIENGQFSTNVSKITNCTSTLNTNKFACKNMDLSNIFSTNGILIDTNNDFLPDTINGKIVIKDNANDYELMAACNVASRLGLETLGIEFPIVYTEKEAKNYSFNKILIGNEFKTNSFLEESNSSFIKIIKENDTTSILLKGENEDLIKSSEIFSKNIPYIDKNKKITLNNLKDKISSSIKLENLEGQLSYLLDSLNKKDFSNSSIDCYLEKNKDNLDSNKILDLFKSTYNLTNFNLLEYAKKETILEKEFDIPWEVDEFQSILEKKLYKNINPGDTVSILGILSEEKSVRDICKNSIIEKLNIKKATIERCDIYCSYKQGLSFIMEDIVPKLKDNTLIKKIDTVTIKVKPFLPKGKTEWDEEDGVIPNLTAPVKDDKGKWFDLPIRFLQELYPIDDLISNEINIPRDNIVFEFMENNNTNNTYEVEVKDSSSNMLLKDSFEVKYSERPYLDEYPSIGKVHPSTGFIKVLVNGKCIIDEPIKTDLERIWDIYQKDILPDCKNYILEKTNNNPTKEKQPFFNQLKLDINVSEPDYPLDVRKDMISSLDALHEDLYFVGLDFFKTFGMKTVNEKLDEPGLILPCINKVNNSKPYMKVSLYNEKFKTPTIFINGKKDFCYKKPSFSLNINEISFKDSKIDKIYFDVKTDCDYKTISSTIKGYSKLFNLLNIKDTFEYNFNFNELIFRVYEGNDLKDTIKLQDEKNNKNDLSLQPISIEDIKMPDDEVIGYEDYIEIINKLKRVPELNVWRVSDSYQGRDIYAIDLVHSCKSNVISTNKLINYKPVFMINNRHHANEISSTNSAFMLIKNMLLDKNLNNYLKNINLTIIPFENVDGGYIHHKLQKDNPEWKLHIARFNSVGKEFYYDYFQDSKYPESTAVPKVWRKWLPDFVADNHGVPSHEWDQQFSGYVSPWFKGFWLPRALFYGYFWYVDSEKYPKHKSLNESLQDKVATWINNDEEISKWNEDWKDRFEKYAHKWMPKLFPANYYKNLIFYWLPYKPDKDSRHVSHRYPWITAVDWTTEVSDETAQGDYLKLCTKTHYISDVATIDMLSKANFDIEDLSKEESTKITLKKLRKRPLKLK